MREIFKFDDLKNAPLIVDAIYEGGNVGNISDDPFSRLFDGIGNLGGFRVAYNLITRKPAFIILYTSGQE